MIARRRMAVRGTAVRGCYFLGYPFPFVSFLFLPLLAPSFSLPPLLFFLSLFLSFLLLLLDLMLVASWGEEELDVR